MEGVGGRGEEEEEEGPFSFSLSFLMTCAAGSKEEEGRGEHDLANSAKMPVGVRRSNSNGIMASRFFRKSLCFLERNCPFWAIQS